MTTKYIVAHPGTLLIMESYVDVRERVEAFREHRPVVVYEIREVETFPAKEKKA